MLLELFYQVVGARVLSEEDQALEVQLDIVVNNMADQILDQLIKHSGLNTADYSTSEILMRNNRIIDSETRDDQQIVFYEHMDMPDDEEENEDDRRQIDESLNDSIRPIDLISLNNSISNDDNDATTTTMANTTTLAAQLNNSLSSSDTTSPSFIGSIF